MLNRLENSYSSQILSFPWLIPALKHLWKLYYLLSGRILSAVRYTAFKAIDNPRSSFQTVSSEIRRTLYSHSPKFFCGGVSGNHSFLSCNLIFKINCTSCPLRKAAILSFFVRLVCLSLRQEFKESWDKNSDILRLIHYWTWVMPPGF